LPVSITVDRVRSSRVDSSPASKVLYRRQ